MDTVHPSTLGSFFHKTRPVTFSLVVNDCGVCFERQEDAEHLVASLKKHRPIKTDLTGSQCVGVDLQWDHINRALKTSMKNCVKQAPLQFQCPEPSKRQHSPSPFTPPICGSKVQMATADNSEPMTPAQKHRLQHRSLESSCVLHDQLMTPQCMPSMLLQPKSTQAHKKP